MAINKKLVHFKTLANFNSELGKGNILETSIVFIQDAKRIWTHGTFYNCPYTKEELDAKFKSLTDADAEILKELEKIDSTYVKKAGDTMTGLLKSTVATGTAPFNVISTTKCENLNADLVDNLDSDSLVNGDSNADWYGIQWSETSSNPDCIRIGNMDMHRTLPILSKMRGCVITNAIDPSHYGNIRYLNSDWTKTIGGLDSDEEDYASLTNVNTFVEIPEYWYIDDYVPETQTHNLKLSDHPKAGWFHHQKSYVSAYEGAILEKDGTKYYMSKKGEVPTVKISRTDLRDTARNNSIYKMSTGGCEYNMYLYSEHRAICHLFLVEYATRNAQKPVNTALTAEGFHQGGLGAGPTEGGVTINGTYTYSCIPTGSSDSLGNSTGEVNVTIQQTDSSGNNTTAVTRKCNRYRGIENLFGHVWKHTDDVISIYDSDIKQRRYYLCEDAELFATYKNEHYKFVTSGPTNVGWKKSISVTPKCDFFTRSVGGSESTYWCDYNYDNTDASQHCLLVGGGLSHGGWAGPLSFNSNHGVSIVGALVGSRLVYLPYVEKKSQPNLDLVNLLAYGIEWDTTVSNPKVTRIGNPLLHKQLPIQSAFRGCVSKGTEIKYYLDPNNWDKKENGEASVLDGTDGDVRVHTPKFYGKSEVSGNKRRVWISLTQIDPTWDEIPEMLIDAYRCTLFNDGGTMKTVSVVNTSAAYRGGTGSTSYDSYLSTDKFRTLLGKPRTNVTRANMRSYATNAGSELLSYELYKWIFVWCYVIEYANFNAQEAYNAALTSEGYHQGGLGNGLTTIWNWSHWSWYNGNNPITPCGYGNSIGNGTGLKTITVASGSNGSNTWPAATWLMPRWRGFDNPFGDIWTNLDGIVIDTPLEGKTNASIVPTAYIITDPQSYTDKLDEAKANYTRKYTQPHGEGWIKDLNLGTHGDIVPKTTGGNVTQYMCDYYWVNYDDTPETLLVGGGLDNGGWAGPLYFDSNRGVSVVGADVGFRSLTRI